MTRFFLSLATFSLLLVSCNKMRKTDGGLEYQIFKSNGGEKIAGGDFVYFKLKAIVSDSTFFDNSAMKMKIKESFEKGNFEEGMTLLGTGDSALFKIDAESFYKVNGGSPPPPFIKKGESILFYVKVDSFVNKKMQEERNTQFQLQLMEKQKNEPTLLEEFVKNSGVKYIKTPSGLYYIITKSTTGAKAAPGDTVFTNYTGKFLNGTIFDTNEGRGQTLDFVLDSEASRIIKGWHEIFGILRLGEKATVILPSSLAYGAEGAGNDIEPFTPLMFDVELVKIAKAKK